MAGLSVLVFVALDLFCRFGLTNITDGLVLELGSFTRIWINRRV